MSIHGMPTFDDASEPTKQTPEDREILRAYYHPQGPRFNGPNRVECRNYDEHRWAFRRDRAGRWVCDECREDSWYDR